MFGVAKGKGNGEVGMKFLVVGGGGGGGDVIYYPKLVELGNGEPFSGVYAGLKLDARITFEV
jgi:hypothetical protein